MTLMERQGTNHRDAFGTGADVAYSDPHIPSDGVVYV
jgi:hypothetical protein